MSHATSHAPGGVVPGWRHAQTGPPAPCALCYGLTCCQSPARCLSCHKGYAEASIAVHAITAVHRACLLAAQTPRKGAG
jgi:hypothetical protein